MKHVRNFDSINEKLAIFKLKTNLFFRILFKNKKQEITIIKGCNNKSKENLHFTIGYIDHNSEVHEEYLGPCLKKLKGDFDLIYTDSQKFPADNYNKIIEKCSTQFLILTHQDVTFSDDLLERLEETIKLAPNFGAIGLVGVNKDGVCKFSKTEGIFELDTLDCCFIMINCQHSLKFNSKIFHEYHLYVEDYCAKQKVLGKKTYTILLNENSYIKHHSHTWNLLGACWGNYKYFSKIFSRMWPDIKTT